MRVAVIIPARMGSSRFPGKPLHKILDLPMVEHVRRRALMAEGVDEVVVATCDEEILQTVRSYKGTAVMTDSGHERCTERVEEASRSVEADIIVNVQGDEPLIDPEIIEKVIAPLLQNDEIMATNIIHVLNDSEEFDSKHVVKCVTSLSGDIMYFSRAAIPGIMVDSATTIYKQSGVMAFRKSFLKEFCLDMKIGPLEKRESIDMLRILENGKKVRSVICEAETVGVDLPEHVKKVEELIMNNKRQKEIYNKIKDRHENN